MTGLALGCSHTAGTGINPSDCYVSVLSRMIGQPIDNRSQSGASHSVLQQKLVQALQAPTIPSFIIAQWPNPIRRITWQDHYPVNENINCASPAFTQLLRQSQENFYQPWLDTIIICNLLCKNHHKHNDRGCGRKISFCAGQLWYCIARGKKIAR